ncbi:hypothetical protein A4X09_0g6644 [Tilletia walkeri]|uniref:HAT C-terminal dimerisation domain-containing protein n=1 Tax=Tilletia walkeri TaxID=117179 RepID=A0A8X7N3R7_9BASI|nr:hypothetical protein A4X09_0g6644 [Tilletia walkeri]
MNRTLRDPAARKLPARFMDTDAQKVPDMDSSTANATDDTAIEQTDLTSARSKKGSPVTPGPPRISTSASSHAPSSELPNEEPDDGTPPSAQRPKPQPLKRTSPSEIPPSASTSAATRTRIQNDRDFDFFVRRSVTRDIDNRPPPPPAFEPDLSDGNSDSDFHPSRTSTTKRAAAVSATSLNSASTSSVSLGAQHDAAEDQSPSEESVVDLTGSSPLRAGPSAVTTPATGPTKKISTGKDQEQGSSKGANPKKKRKGGAALAVSAAATPIRKEKESSTSNATTTESSKNKASKTSHIEPEDALTFTYRIIPERAQTAWRRAQKESEQRIIAEAAGKPWKAPAGAASDKYVYYNEPYLKSHPSLGRDEVGIAFDCLCCDPVYTAWRPLRDGSTSLLETHLNTRRSIEGRTENSAPGASKDTGPLDRFLVKSSRISGISAPDESLSDMRARLCGVAWVTEEARPMSIVEDKWFLEFLPQSRRNIVPKRRTVSRDVDKSYEAMQGVIRQRLATISGAIHLALDVWTSPNGHSYLGVIGCWQEQGLAQRHVLDMITFTKRHTAEYLAISVKELAERLGISAKIWFIAGDNASVNTAMMHILGRDSDLSRVEGQSSQIRCIAHVLNLISEAIIKPFNKAARSAAINSGSCEGGVADEDEGDWSSDEEAAEGSDEDESDVAGQDDRAISASLHPNQFGSCADDVLISDALARKNVAFLSAQNVRASSASASRSKTTTSSIQPPAPSEELRADSGVVGAQIRQLAWFARKLRYNTRLRESFQQTCSNFSLKEPYSLIRDVATRWNSTMEMIERALVLWEAIIAWQESNHKLIPPKFRLKRGHHSAFQQIIKLLQPLQNATLNFSKKTAPTIGDVVGLYEELDAHYRSVEENEDIAEVWREGARRANAVGATYYGMTDDTRIYYLAVTLHPNMRRPFMKAMKWEASWMDRAEQTLHDVYDAHYRPQPPESQSQSTQPSESQQSTRTASFLQQEMVQMAAAQAAQAPPDPVAEWLKGYLSAGKKGEMVDPLSWWWDQSQKGNDHSGLTALALDIFSAPATSVDAERLFSQAGHHITPLRHRLKARKLGRMVTLGAWFREGWVPDTLLTDFHKKKEQEALKRRAKRQADKEVDQEGEPSNPKRMRLNNE